MNPKQLSTMEEAKAIAAKLGTIGGGVADIYDPSENDHNPFLARPDGEAKWYHFRFKNGVDGFNVGLIRTFMQVFPSRWPLMVSTEVDAAAKFRFDF
jgi:hypothetical protein